jgi:hypothetical protein
MSKHHILVDFDGTLSTWHSPVSWHDDWRAIGEPIPLMVSRVKKWLAEGEDVRIFTARMDGYHPKGRVPVRLIRQLIQAWCLVHIGVVLPVTNRKSYWCKAIYDDRAFQVERDTGRVMGEE